MTYILAVEKNKLTEEKAILFGMTADWIEEVGFNTVIYMYRKLPDSFDEADFVKVDLSIGEVRDKINEILEWLKR